MSSLHVEVLEEFAEAQGRVSAMDATGLTTDGYRVFHSSAALEWRDYIREYMREYRALNGTLRGKVREYMRGYNRRPDVIAREKARHRARKESK